MRDGKRSGLEGRRDWPVRIAGGAGAAVALTLALLLGPRIGMTGFWQGLITVVVVISVGGILGRLVGSLLFPPSSGSQSDSSTD